MTRTDTSTAPIKALFVEALESLDERTEDVIDHVFFAIERNPEWLHRYNSLCESRGKTTVNTWGGYWVANAVERIGLVQVQAQKSTLIVSYSKLDKPALPRKSRATTEQAAREAVFSFYSSNKSSLPHQVRNVREEIVEMVMAGMSPLDAFAQALKLSPS